MVMIDIETFNQPQPPQVSNEEMAKLDVTIMPGLTHKTKMWEPFFKHFHVLPTPNEQEQIMSHMLFFISSELKKVFQKSLERLKKQKWGES